LIRNDDGTTFEIGDFVGTIELNINRAVEIVNFAVRNILESVVR
jgi:hypothetical protein